MSIVLIVDDQAAIRSALEVLCDVHDIPAVAVATPAAAVERVKRGGVAVVVQDMNFTRDTTGGEEGVELFRALRAVDATLPIVLLTAWASLETAVALVKEGATDYLAKPWDDVRLVATLRALLARRSAAVPTSPRLPGAPDTNVPRSTSPGRSASLEAKGHDLCGLVYESQAMHDLVSLALHVAGSDVPVLVTGPNGSGKEKIAEIVQRGSARTAKPFLKVNAGALPDTLLESELFGADAGAFTGAVKSRVGRFEAADGGTLFLDEVGNLSLSAQMKLLRVLQTGEYERLGSTVTRRANVRMISATNADLPRAIAEKTFREDLYFRLNLIELRVPALADRRDDIMPLANTFLLACQTAGAIRFFGRAARRALEAHLWPGNVRELENRVRRASILARGEEIRAADLDLASITKPAEAGQPGGKIGAPSASADAALPNELGEPWTRESALSLLARFDGKIAHAAAAVGLSRQAFYRRLERVGLSPEQRTKPEE